MSVKSLMFLASALAIAGVVLEPLAAQADGMSQLGTWGRPAGMGAHVSNVACDGLAGFNNVRPMSVPGVNSSSAAAFHSTMPGVSSANMGNIGMPGVLGAFNAGGAMNSQSQIQQSVSNGAVSSGLGNRPLNVTGGYGDGGTSGGGGVTNNYNITKNSWIDNSKNIDVTNNIDASKNITINKPVNIYKPVTINKSIDASKSIDITKNIDNSKVINASKNITINKNIDINNAFFRYGFGHGGGGGTSNITVISEAGAFAEAGAGAASGGDIDVAAEAGGTCHFVDTTVVKAIHAICVSADGHQFPASHMTGETWINSGYEGEIARCLPGSTLKVMVGSVMMSSEGMAVSMNDAQVLACAPGQAARHFKGGMLKCAAAVKVPDCTERTNLRKWGTGDMFFTYATRVCLDQRREVAGGTSRVSTSYSYIMTADQQQMAADAADAKARTLHLPGNR